MKQTPKGMLWISDQGKWVPIRMTSLSAARLAAYWLNEGGFGAFATRRD